MGKNFLIEDAKFTQEIDVVRRSELQDEYKIHEISKLKKSKLIGSNSSIQTIFSTVNTMIGSTTLILPVIFAKIGIVTCLLVMLVLCSLNYLTANLLIRHGKSTDEDLPDIINRILGYRYFQLFSFMSALLCFFVSVVYYLLQCSMVYQTLKFIFSSLSLQIADRNIIDYSQFSYQYTNMIMIVFVFLLLSLKSLKLLLKISQYGTITVILFIMFIIFCFIRNILENGSIAQIEQRVGNLNYFTDQFDQATGTFSLSFLIHNFQIPIYRQNKIQENNSRDLGISYIIVYLIYAFVGTVGYLGVFGSKIQSAQNLMDYFPPNDISVFVISLLFAIFLLCILPFLVMLGRNQFLGLFFNETQNIPNIYKYIFNLVFCSVCLICGLVNYDPNRLLGLTGAITCFFSIYLLPVMIHFKCLYSKKYLLKSDLSIEQEVCNHNYLISKNRRRIFYSSLIIFGLYLMISGVAAQFN